MRDMQDQAVQNTEAIADGLAGEQTTGLHLESSTGQSLPHTHALTRQSPKHTCTTGLSLIDKP